MTKPAPARSAIAALGRDLGPDMLAATIALCAPEQRDLAARGPVPTSDHIYGPHPRQRLDLYRGVDAAVPVLLWVHGGGFVQGDKAAPDGLFNAHVGRLAARSGFLGAVMNYRLAPDHIWPSGGDDVGAAVDWLRGNVAAHGGDPDRIILAGTSAGSVHIATFLQRADASALAGLRGAVLLSGLYGATPVETRDRMYFGQDIDAIAGRMPLDALVETGLPLFVACAEFDPTRFQIETMTLLSRRLARHGHLPRCAIGTGQNHYSMAMHLGGADTRLTDEILGFCRDCTAAGR